MTEPDVQRPTPPVRRALSIVALIVALCYGALAGYGVVNPRQYVVLNQYFHNPALGAMVLLALIMIAWVLAFPVRSTVIDRRRSQVRTTLIILALISFIVYWFVFFTRVYRFDPRTIATSPSGQRSIVVLHGFQPTVHVFAGTGLTRRDMGSFGVPCGLADGTEARFVGETEVEISTPYNDYRFQLTPDGVPLGRFGSMCAFY